MGTLRQPTARPTTWPSSLLHLSYLLHVSHLLLATTSTLPHIYSSYLPLNLLLQVILTDDRTAFTNYLALFPEVPSSIYYSYLLLIFTTHFTTAGSSDRLGLLVQLPAPLSGSALGGGLGKRLVVNMSSKYEL